MNLPGINWKNLQEVIVDDFDVVVVVVVDLTLRYSLRQYFRPNLKV